MVSRQNAVMLAIIRGKGKKCWTIEEAPLDQIANVEKMMPRRYISEDGFGISEEGRQYLSPLIQGEDYPPYGKNGLPDYAQLKKAMVDKKIRKKFSV